MTTPESTLLSAGAATVEAIAELTRQGAEGEALPPGAIYAFHLGDKVQIVDLTGEEHRDTPRRKAGTVVVRDVASFVAYWDKHSDSGVSEVYADRENRRITAVLDSDSESIPGWRGHRLVLRLEFSEAFKAWSDRDGRFMTQEQFADFLDDQRADIHRPTAAEMLEIAQTIQGTSTVDWQAGHRLVDGQRRIGYVETNSAQAGSRGELAIPTEIVIGVPIFDGAVSAHAITARFRHRIEGGNLRLMYKLDRPADVVTAAFDGAVTELGEACEATVLRGTPAV